MPTEDLHWYALHVRLHYELSVASRLKDLGVEEYVPIKRVKGLSKRNRFSDGMPLFPGYIFSHLDLRSGPRLYGIPGMIRIVGSGDHPSPVDEEEMQTIRVIVSSGLEACSVPYFTTGDQIVLTDGPLCGVRGTYVATKKAGQLIVALPLLKRSLAVTVLSEWVAKDNTTHDPHSDKILFA